MLRYLVHHHQVRQQSSVQDQNRSGKRSKAADNVGCGMGCHDRPTGLRYKVSSCQIRTQKVWSTRHGKPKAFRAFRVSGMESTLGGSHSRVRMMRIRLGLMANSQRCIERFSDGA
jgi:hypothetical protein